MKNAWKYLLAAAAVFLIGKTYGFLIAALLLVVLVAVLLYTRRATLFTKQAMTLYYMKGNPSLAEVKFEKAYKTGEMPPECKIAYSSFCLREDKFAKGKKLLNEVINSRFSSSENKLGAKHNLAVLMWKEGDLDGALELMAQVHKQVPATNTYGTMGVLLLEKVKLNEYDVAEASAFMQEAYDYNDGDKTIADNLGEFYYITGEYEKAKEVYEKLLTNELQTPMPYYNFGRVLKALGDNEGAREAFNSALDKKFTSVLTVTREDIQKEIESL